MESFFHNPIALLFLSYGIGAAVVPIVKDTDWFKRMTAKNFINDKWTKYSGVL